ncbi:hypothetical protein [Serratia marcescens]|uniref:hypothetical protein n=1 Tax=Serratia marcescens TaxID=615 RepID=UPI0034E845E1
MTSIQFPCETAAIFQDVIYVIRPNHVSELLREADRAAEFFLGHFPYVSLDVVREGILYSFGGRYLNDYELIREAS